MKPAGKAGRSRASPLLLWSSGGAACVLFGLVVWWNWPRPTAEEAEIGLVKPVQVARAEFRAALGREPADVVEFEPQLRQAYGAAFRSLEKRAADQYIVHIDHGGPRRILITYRVDRDGQPEAFETLVEAGP
jgi:hypothetical protein